MSEAEPLTDEQVELFKQTMANFYQTGEELPLQVLFRLFDRNGDGLVSRSELKLVMGTIDSDTSEEAIDNMMQEADTNHDGFIDMSEFVVVMKKHLN